MMITRNLMNKYGVVMIPEDIKSKQEVSYDKNTLCELDEFILRMYTNYNVIIKNVDMMKNIKEEHIATYLEMFEKAVKRNYGQHKSNVIFKVGVGGDIVRSKYNGPQILSYINHLTGYVWTKYDNVQNEIPTKDFLNGIITLTVESHFDVMKILMKDICGVISIKPDDFDWMKQVIHPGMMMVDKNKIEILNRENKSMVIQWLYEEEFDFAFLITTVGDVMRFFDEYQRNCDKTTRRFRKTVAKVLNDLSYNNKIEDYYRDREKWIFVFDLLHIGDYFKTYKTLEKEVKLIKFGKKPEFFNKKLEDAKSNGDFRGMIKLLSDRPGEFTRNFTTMLRISKNERDVYTILDTLYSMRDRVTQKSLIELVNGLKNYNEDFRIFKPKGGKLYSVENFKNPIKDHVIDLCIKHLSRMIEIKMTNGEGFLYDTVYIANELKQIPLPLVIRDQSESSLSLPRYSRISFAEDTKILRFFTHWNNGTTSPLDVDLSAILLKPNYDIIDRVYYGSIENAFNKFNIRHSGDMRTDNSAEYIDIDIDTARKHGIRYVVSMINIYSGPENFKSIKKCFGGVMELPEFDNDKYVDISKVRIKSEINCEYNACVPIIIDLVRREVVWVDRIAHEITEKGSNVDDIHYGYTNTMLAKEYAQNSISVLDYFTMFSNVNAFNVEYINDIDILNLSETELSNSLTVGLFNGDIRATKQSEIIEYLK